MENVEIIPTKGHPLIYADWLHAPGKPTVLCYAHYDVQPPDPLDEWISPPFEPAERNNNLYARGAVDDKGQLWLEVKALESLLKAHNGSLPINVKVIFEGEEEVGGESIAAYVAKRRPSSSRFRTGLRHGIICSESSHAVRRPARAGLHRDRSLRRENGSTLRHVRGRCTQSFLRADRDHQQNEGCKGKSSDSRLFIKASKLEQDELKPGSACLSMRSTTARPKSDQRCSPESLASQFYIAPGASHARSSRHARWIHRSRRQDCDSGQGGRQSFHAPRANQDPDDILKKYTADVKKLTPKGIETKIKVWSKGPAASSARTTATSKLLPKRCAMSSRKIQSSFALAAQFPSSPTFRTCSKFQRDDGFGLPDDNLHAPNEKFHIPNFPSGD